MPIWGFYVKTQEVFIASSRHQSFPKWSSGGFTWYHVVQAWTNDEFLSNVHRVANPPPGAGHSESITMHFQLANLTQGKICEVQCGFVVQTPFRAGWTCSNQLGGVHWSGQRHDCGASVVASAQQCTAVHSSVDLVDKVVWSRRILNQSSWSLNEKKRSLVFGSHVSSRLAMELIWSFEFQGITNWLLLPKAHLCQPRAASKVRLIGLDRLDSCWRSQRGKLQTSSKYRELMFSQKHE